MTAHEIALKKRRFSSLSKRVCDRLDQFLQESRNAEGRTSVVDPFLIRDSLDELVALVYEFGLHIASFRLKSDSDDLVTAIINLVRRDWVKEMKDMPPEKREWLEEKIGPCPEPLADDGEQEAGQRIRFVDVVGRVRRIADLVRELQGDIAEGGGATASAAAEVAGETRMAGDAADPSPVRHSDDDSSAQWEPPKGYVGRKTVCGDSRFKKCGKSPAATTIDVWVKTAEKNGLIVKKVRAPLGPADQSNLELSLREEMLLIVRAPDSGENHYPEAWIKARIKGWNPRPPRT